MAGCVPRAAAREASARHACHPVGHLIKSAEPLVRLLPPCPHPDCRELLSDASYRLATSGRMPAMWQKK